ncbi:APH(3') family aminoglycoside O-phosphotransferase [Tumebacillus permanentifrigoris]|uniref:Kanamycin kinase/aminoglycoside 3'-phosphotransferase-2 n=1 Tax=Tumebacillus permanentifrigoris TaxID=378543 RepID=A0A316DA54_9BACL|nr:APH(3') family aminoglycoside O-phosphotransferase [Tumebacillus permanentifrigoris]PWK13503.1 kanamycin kinase/aminoglycoside 3'-phosphotransferase-2 [Tumebacillus permanentifrigoris]
MVESLREVIGNCRWEELTIGRSGATMHRLVGLEGQPTRYLKMMDRFSGTALAFEAERMRWAAQRLPAPDVLEFREEGIMEYLLMSEVPGAHAADPMWQGRTAELVPVLAQGLRQIHATPWQECPYEMRPGWLLQMAKINLHSGLADVDAMAALHPGQSAEDVLQELIATRPETTEQDLVVVHGDYCFPNILLNPDDLQITGFVDWGNLGIGDRYLDLAIAVKSIIMNVGVEWVEPFLQAYGLEKREETKLQWFRVLDSFL